MNKRTLYLLLLSVIGPISFAEDYQIPTTSWGVPDLQGIWTNVTVTSLERPEFVDTLVVDESVARNWEKRNKDFFDQFDVRDEEKPPEGGDIGGYNSFWMDAGTRLMEIDGQFRTSIITDPEDGKIPYRVGSRAKLGAFFMRVVGAFDGPEQRPLGERCIVGFGSTGGPPMLPVLYNNHYRIVQSPEHIMIMAEMNHDARIVRIDGEHPDKSVQVWLGDSIGHWEGNTLVVETTNFHPGQSFRAAIKHQLYTSPEVKVTEYFTRVSDDEINYKFTIDDPNAFTQVWHGEMPFKSAEGPIYEYACHEGNYSLPGILAGARKEEAEAATNAEGGAE